MAPAILGLLLPTTIAGGTAVALGLAAWRLGAVAREASGRAFLGIFAAFLLHGAAVAGWAGAEAAARSLWYPLAGLAVGTLPFEPDGRRFRAALLGTLCAAAAVWLVWGLRQDDGRVRYGFLVARSAAALQMTFGSLLAAATAAPAVSVFLAASMFTFESRTAQAAWAVAAALGGAWWLPRRTVFLGLAAGLLLVTAVRPTWWTRWTHAAPSVDPPVFHRALLWKVAREEWLAAPGVFLWGHGFGALRLTPEKTGPALAHLSGRGEPGHAHNSYLDLLHAAGVAGFLALFGFYAAWARVLWDWAREGAAARAALLALAAAVLSAWGDKTFTTTPAMLPLWGMIGLAIAERRARPAAAT